MIAARRMFAGPFYLLAFIFHLLTAFFTFAAQYISGDDFKERGKSIPLILVAIFAVCAVAVSAMLAKPKQILSADRFVIHSPSDFRGVKVGYNAEEMKRARDLIRVTACTFTEEAIRYSLRPARVSFRSCSSEADFLITISEDLIDVSVAGLTKINGATDRFNVTLQHYPSSVDVEGFQMTAVELRSAP